MNLLVDIGNTRIKWAIVSSDGWTSGIPQMHRSQPASLFDQMWGNLSTPEKMVISNVAGAEFADSLRRWSELNWSLTPQFIHPKEFEAGVTNAYYDASQLGSDRWAALLGARELCKEAAAVVDCGTAVTVDGIDAQGCFRGGVGHHIGRTR